MEVRTHAFAFYRHIIICISETKKYEIQFDENINFESKISAEYVHTYCWTLRQLASACIIKPSLLEIRSILRLQIPFM